MVNLKKTRNSMIKFISRSVYILLTRTPLLHRVIKEANYGFGLNVDLFISKLLFKTRFCHFENTFFFRFGIGGWR